MRSAGPGPAAVDDPRGLLRFLLGFAVLYAVLAGLADLDPSASHGLLVLAAVLVAALVVERALDGTGAVVSLHRIGLGRPALRAVLVAVVLGLLVQLVYPLLTLTTGASAVLRPDWPWLLVGIFALHGVAEELVWRGYAFRRLRAGRSFRRAVLWTMPLIAATHIPVVVTSGPAVGAAAMLVAAVTTVPLARLYEAGRNTVWAPAVLHTAIDSFKLVVVPAAALTTFSLLLAAVSLVIPLLAVPRWVAAGSHDARAARPLRRSSGGGPGG
jgi:hypothetical protein